MCGKYLYLHSRVSAEVGEQRAGDGQQRHGVEQDLHQPESVWRALDAFAAYVAEHLSETSKIIL